MIQRTFRKCQTNKKLEYAEMLKEIKFPQTLILVKSIAQFCTANLKIEARCNAVYQISTFLVRGVNPLKRFKAITSFTNNIKFIQKKLKEHMTFKTNWTEKIDLMWEKELLWLNILNNNVNPFF
jgi:hypothetical protein